MRHSTPAWKGYLFAVAACAGATAIALPFRDSIRAENAVMLYLVGIALAAAYRGRAIAIFAACISVAAYNFFFTRPYYSFAVDSYYDIITIALLFLASLIIGEAAETARKRTIEAEAEKLRNTLLSSVSHDLRTPLASVRGCIEAVLESSKSALSSEAAELLESARDQSVRLTRMVNDVLDMNRLETGAPLLNRQPYYINEVIGAAMSHVKPWLGGRVIKTDIELRLPLIIVDGALMEQVLVNLLENAIKYTPDDGAIVITVQRKPNHLLLSVSDNGCGIPGGAEQKIFEKFYRASNNPKIQGSGLGLAICKAIVGAHSGQIWAANNEKAGMAVMMTLPLDNALISEEAERQAAHG